MPNVSKVSKLFISSLFILAVFVAPRAEKYVSLNVGPSPSKSVLGVSYTQGLNEINLGLKGLKLRPLVVDYNFQPGITYNRYLAASGAAQGLYGGLTWAPTYHYREVKIPMGSGSDPSAYTTESHSESGWLPGDVFAHMGRTFQFASWAINLDAGFTAPVAHTFAQDLDFGFGFGASYRFKLE